MLNKNLLVFFFALLFCGFSTKSSAQQIVNPTKLVYTITVEGLVNQEQVDHLEKTFKQKIGIISGEVDLQQHQVIVKTSEEITYRFVCDILDSEGVKAQQYVLTKE